jgi:hypothetical protein
MGVGPSEPQHVDILTGDRTHHIGAGDENPTFGRQDHHVSQCWSVRRTASCEAQHDGDLRDFAGGLGHRMEDPTNSV